ncbi:MAG TPA: primosomal protein N', partial [Planctomycetota bacterium]|nr:primosomal protein N' [Planctomycetota bacterium]
MFAKIALDLPVPTEFTYAVPARLLAELKPGQRVRVPFRTQTRVGYLVALEESSDVPETRDILAVVDPEPLVPPDLLNLARWIGSYYGCALGEAIQAMLPRVVRLRQPRAQFVVRTGEGELPARARKAGALLDALGRFARPPTVKRLLDAAGTTRAALRTLERAGLVRVEENEREDDLDAGLPVAPEAPHVLETPQLLALDAIRPDLLAPRFHVHLLLGVTGSGKTEVYLRAIEETLRTGRQAIVLVPEIALTPQTVRRFRARFARIAVLHSAQGEAKRRAEWKRIRRGEADVVIGPRSAVFAPVPRLGLVVVDEEHETSFKQNEGTPLYHARDVAIVRARDARCPVILGSATPSLESYANGLKGRYALHRLPERAGGFPLPPVEIVDLSQEGSQLFSRRLRVAVADAVAAGGQVILFLNRRGFSTIVVCERCRHTLGCPNCSSTLVFHKGRARTVCHLCGHEARATAKCPECHAPALKYVGSGTERVAEEAADAWPGVKLVRVDSDSARGERLEDAIESFRKGEARLLVGTQMVAKGHHFPDVTLVGIVNADTALHLPDFRANERTFSLISQVAGRAGRGDRGGRVIVQTFNPRHYAIETAARHDYEAFAGAELEERVMLGLPPERRCALAVLSAAEEADARAAAQRVADAVRSQMAGGMVELRGPAKAPIERVRGKWRYMVLLLSKSAGALARACAAARGARVPRRVGL